jgi:alcohol dehydrogenase (quinone), cytochrome c subunit
MGKKTIMKRIIFITIAAFFALLPQAQAQNDANAVSRGAYVAKLGDCIACHSAPGHEPFAGGLPMNSPMGIIYSTNITPDPVNGIGRYSIDDFKRAVRDGVAKDGHHLYPAMPYTNFSLISDQDMADLYAYFMKGVKPVAYKPPPTKLQFPFSQRWGLYLWNLFFAPGKRFQPQPDHDELWNRGAYLVKGLGHCGACHTPRDVFYKEKGYSESDPTFLAGNTIDDWQAANLRGNPASGLGRWSEADIASFLKTGHARGVTAFGSMTQVVEDNTQYMNDRDLQSVVHYLKSLETQQESASYAPVRPAPTSASYPIERPGAGVFMALCARCHGSAGEGASSTLPALAGNPVVLSQDPKSLIHIVLEGGTAARTETNPRPQTMPAFGRLTDREIGEVLSFIRASWGNKAGSVSTGDVTRLRVKLAKDNETKRRAARRAE